MAARWKKNRKMADLLERIMARYPRVGQRCFELEAISLAKKAAGLKEGDSLLKSEDDILPALAQAVHESDVDLADMARDCGFEPIELRRKLALGRVGELLKPGEISGLARIKATAGRGRVQPRNKGAVR